MKYGLVILSLLMSLIFVLPACATESLCSYCGVWVPFSEKYGTPYSSKDRLTITEQTVAIPGCSPTKATQVFLTNKTHYSFSETDRLKPLKAILQLVGTMNCTRPLPGLSNGAIVEIELRPRGYENSEELELVFFAPTTPEELKASYTHQLIPTPQGQKQMMKRPPRPTELGGWWFIREKYDPCGEGEGRGAWICSAIEHKKADELLNSEWQLLINVISPNKKKALITTQKKWLKACESKCAKEGGEYGGHHPWPLAIETMCLSGKKKERSIEFRELNECINSGKLDCQQLKTKH